MIAGFRRTLGAIGFFWNFLLPPKIADQVSAASRAPESPGDGPEAVSAPSPAAPASGQPGTVLTAEGLREANDLLHAAADYKRHLTSAGPPAAEDDPGASSPLAPGSPPQAFTLIRGTLGVELGAEDDADDFNWQRWVLPAITKTLANHVPMQLFPGGSILCARTDGSPCADCTDWDTWVDHVAPQVASRIHAAAVEQPALVRCQHCQQPIELFTDIADVNGFGEQRAGVYMHKGTDQHQCVDIPGFRRTYASPEK